MHPLLIQLESRGFIHAPTIDPQKFGRYQIEVFPHPAIVNLFNLERILKYKKGRINERRLELIKLYNYILDILPSLSPPLRLLSGDARKLATAALTPVACGGKPSRSAGSLHQSPAEGNPPAALVHCASAVPFL